MTEFLKDRYKLGLILATLFFLGILLSLYSIYSIPSDLTISGSYQPTFARVLLIVGATFAIGGIAIWNALQHKQEVIVFRDRQADVVNEKKENIDTKKTTISLENINNAISQSSNEKELLQAGLNIICKELEAGQGALYLVNENATPRKIELQAGYALNIGESTVISYEFGEGLVGQVASGKKTIYADEIPDGYIKILSGLGSASPKYLLIVPVKKNDQVRGVMEVASFTPITEDERKFVEESAQLIADRMSGN
jgi:signal transduction protein with GAF and PtsI domain